MRGGYQFNDFIAAEAGVHIVSGFDRNESDSKFDIDYKSYSFGGAARYPLGEHFALTGKVGYHFWDAQVNTSSGSGRSVDESDLYFGGGLEFKTGKVSFRVEYSRYEVDEIDADVISVGLVIPL